METKSAVCLTLKQGNLQFIEKIADETQRSKSAIIDYVLDSYRKFKLKNDIVAGFKSQTKENLNEAMSDFGDYLEIVEK